MKNKIKAIFFDVGNVLIEEGFSTGIKEYEKVHNISDKKLYASCHDHSYWKEFSLGNITEKQYFEKVEQNFDGSLDIAELKEIILENFFPNNDLIDYAKSLSANYALGIISNNPREWFKWVMEKFELKEIFKFNAISGYLHIRKPDPELFKHALMSAGVTPHEAVYVDDRKEMTLEAENLGMNTIIYKNMKDLRLQFEKLKIINK